MATATATMESQTLMSSERHTYEVTEQRHVTEKKKKKSMRRHKDEGTISVSKSSEKLFKKMKAADAESNPLCEKCARPVFAMERVKAEKRAWHKECFRCVQCNKQLTVETYESEHTTLYCKPHFKQLFGPKPVDAEENETPPPKKHQMIICESNPVELPPDVVRASDKPDLGLEELAQLDVKSRFEVFEKKTQAEEPPPPEPRAPREKSTALLSRLAKFKAKGMDIGVSDEYLNGVPLEGSSSEPEEGEDGEDEDSVLRRSYKLGPAREQAVSLANMAEIVGRFERGADGSARHLARKQEIQNIRSRLFMGKQAKIKEMYEQSVLQSEQGITSAEKLSRLEVDAEKARAIKERFESGQLFQDENTPPRRDIDDQDLFNEGIGKKSRSIFLELDANAAQNAPRTPPAPHTPPRRKEIPFIPKDVVRAEDKVEEVQVETADISDRFRFFETYKPEPARKQFRMTPPRQLQPQRSPSPEPYVDPALARGGDAVDTAFAADRHTASRMIDVFTQMQQRRDAPQGPKPLKCFTPPPPGESNHHGDSSSEYSSDEEDSEAQRRRAAGLARDRDEALKQAQQLARTTSFRDRFERWPASSPPPRAPPAPPGGPQQDDDGESQLETAKSLREKFENMNVQQSSATKNTTPRVNRFV